MRIRTGYSFRSAAGQISEVLSRLKEIGWACAPISDRASTFGWCRWKKISEAANMKPIFGIELAVSPNINDKKPIADFWTFFAIDEVKYINRLAALATNQFRYQPLLSYDQALGAEGVIKIAGSRALLDKCDPATENFYLSLSPSTPRRMMRSQKYNFIACSDNKYPRPEDQSLYEIICGRNAETHSYAQYILSDEEWLKATKFAGEDIQKRAIENREHCIEMCNAHLKKAELLKPDRPDTLRNMCIDGAKKLNCNLDDPVYKARIDKELTLIHKKNFDDYFYILTDLVQWSRKHMMVGPARGSSCGSLVCYLLGITTIDPIPFGLIFERFIDLNRMDLPDIDLDFPEDRRHLAFEYMNEKYGKERVARLGTVALYKPKSAINEAAAALKIPKWKTDKVLDSLIERSGGDSRALQTMEDTYNDTEAGRNLIKNYPELLITTKMEGHPRHSSQHAAGIVITDQPLEEYVALDNRVGATMCDKKDAEVYNLLKLDALGLTQLSVFEEALRLAHLPIDFLFGVPLDDASAYKIIQDEKFSGVFQFNGLALQSIATQIKVSEFEDIVATTALARPGPMASGGTNEWIKRKNGVSPTSYPHPLFEPYLKNTLGIVSYQEQIMEIGRNVGSMSWEDVSALRKAMSKSLGKEFFNKYGEKFKSGAIAKGIPKDVCDSVWDDLCAYGSWCFNRSHAVAYGLISYWCCWMKSHYPFEFAAATLQYESNPDKQINLLREIHAEGIDYIPVSAEKSRDRWQPAIIEGRKVLVGPLSAVKGIGPKMVSQIMSAKARNEPIPSRAQKLLNHPKTDIDSLWPVSDAIQRLLPDPREKNIFTKPMKVKDVQCRNRDYEALIIAKINEIKPRDKNDPISVAKRGYELRGPSMTLNLRVSDDTDMMFTQIGRYDFERLARKVIERGGAGTAIYAIKGTVPKDFRMICIKAIRYIGDMDENKEGNKVLVQANDAKA